MINTIANCQFRPNQLDYRINGKKYIGSLKIYTDKWNEIKWD